MLPTFLSQFLIFALIAVGSLEIPLQRDGFVALPNRPTAADIECANYTAVEWVVTRSDGNLHITVSPRSQPDDPLPFTYKRTEGRLGFRHVLPVENGWLVGFDAGEFGGGLWWFSRSGRQATRIRPSSVAHAGDPFHAENVRGFGRIKGKVLAFMGLDHLGGRSGRIFEVFPSGRVWILRPFALLDASPAGWVTEGNRLFVITSSGLWEFRNGMYARQLKRLDLGMLYPSSLAKGPDGALYAGLRRYVLRLRQEADGWKDTWFVKTDCVRARVTNYTCECLP
jgi:hypothetical protein